MVRHTEPANESTSNISDHAAKHGHATAIDVLFDDAEFAGQEVTEADAGDVLFGDADEAGERGFF